VLDDFYGWLPWDFLLRLLDRYPLLVETKGGQVQFVAKTVVITSNKPYLEWYSESFDKAPLTRRLTRYTWVEDQESVNRDLITVPCTENLVL